MSDTNSRIIFFFHYFFFAAVGWYIIPLLLCPSFSGYIDTFRIDGFTFITSRLDSVASSLALTSFLCSCAGEIFQLIPFWIGSEYTEINSNQNVIRTEYGEALFNWPICTSAASGSSFVFFVCYWGEGGWNDWWKKVRDLTGVSQSPNSRMEKKEKTPDKSVTLPAWSSGLKKSPNSRNYVSSLSAWHLCHIWS